MFGPSEWAGRLVPALAAIGVMLLLWDMGRAMFGERAGIIGALVWATSLLSFGMARVLSTDMLLTASIGLAIYGMWNALEKSEHAADKHKFSAVAGAGMGLALSRKALWEWRLPLGIALVYLTVGTTLENGSLARSRGCNSIGCARCGAVVPGGQRTRP
jgi:4-amino-4-deoxy-L-arabinose transferase-like glycosyltransferase